VERIARDRKRLAGDVYERLVAAMIDGTLKPGDRLVMDKLAEELDVSRTPIRDAIQRLHAEGIVQPAGRRGFTVRHLSEGDIFYIYEGRLAIEGYAAGRVAELKGEALDPAWRTLERAEARSIASAAESFEANRLIHRAIVDATGNRLLLTCFDLSWGLAIAGLVYRDFYVAQSNDRFIDEHRTLLQAIADGDEASAREAMVAHIRNGLARTPVDPMAIDSSVN
jgi:DNA-binding GntR family transcriptional regulator